MPLPDITFIKAAKAVFQEYAPRIEDIILFGSSMREKSRPEDVDILFIFKERIEKEAEYKFKKKIGRKEIDVQSITKSELEQESFLAKEGIYLEGFSLIKERFIQDMLGFKSIAFIRYDLSNIKGSRRVQFYYALCGRNKRRGFLHEINARRFSEAVIGCDYQVSEKAKEFFDFWGITYEIIPALIPQRLRKIIVG